MLTQERYGLSTKGDPYRYKEDRSTNIGALGPPSCCVLRCWYVTLHTPSISIFLFGSILAKRSKRKIRRERAGPEDMNRPLRTHTIHRCVLLSCIFVSPYAENINRSVSEKRLCDAMTDSENRMLPPCAGCSERIIRSRGSQVPRCRYYKDVIPKEIVTCQQPCPHRNIQKTL